MAHKPTPLGARQRALKQKFIDVRGSWNPIWDPLLEWDPAFLEAYFEFSAVPWRKGVLPPKFKELIYIAIDASTTHLYAPGVRRHIRNALKLGASRDEILEVLELTSVLGIHACNLGVPILAEELAAMTTAAKAPSRSRRKTAAKPKPPGRRARA